MSYLKIQQQFDPAGSLSKERLIETPPGSLLGFGLNGEAVAVPASFDFVVDATYGNDAHGGKPGGAFKTLSAARDAAVTAGGGLIVVQPGAYTDNDLLRTGVNWYFHDGATISYTAAHTGTAKAIFDDNGAAVVCSIDGRAEITWNGNGNTALYGAVSIQHASSEIVFRARRVNVLQLLGGAAGSASAFYIGACKRVHVKIDEVIDLNTVTPDAELNSFVLGIYWGKGDIHVECDYLVVDANYALWGHEPASADVGNFWYTGNLVKSLNGTGLYVDATNGANFRSWIRFHLLEAAILGISTSVATNAKTYIEADKISATTPVVGGGVLWVTAQKLTCPSGSTSFVTCGAGENYISVLHYEDLGGSLSSGAGIVITGGTTYIMGGIMKTANSPGVNLSAGSATISDMRIDTTGTNAAGNRPVVVSGTGLTLRNCWLVSPALVIESVYAGTAKTIKNKGTCATVAKHANITVQVEALVIDTNVT